MAKKPTKFIFVTGGVLSGLGKGITAASIGNLLKARGLKVNIQKCDPYLNEDAGTLNPAEHGECFVTFDGAETDLDLGHYERFIDQELDRHSSLMSGRVLRKVIDDERAGKYLGKTIQYIPHVTRAIQQEIVKASEGFDVHIVEIGGTVGDYESLSFIEAIRELALKVGREDSMFVHVVYMPYLGASKEYKTKPAQNAVRELRGLGIVPDVLAVRSEDKGPKSAIKKLSLFSGVPEEAIVMLPNAKNIYEVPLTIEDSGVAEEIAKRLGLKGGRPKLHEWRGVVKRATTKFDKTVSIGVVAKYLDNQDTYMSVFEALKSAAWWQGVNLKIRWVDAEEIEKNHGRLEKAMQGLDGIVVPGGFGIRALEGKIAAAGYSFDNKLPYLGLCLGLQMAVVAAARRGGLKGAVSEEMDDKARDLVIHTMSDQHGKHGTGGTMRLGDYPCEIDKNSLAANIYKSTKITERHRHRYECNNAYRDLYEQWGIRAVGTSPDGNLVEIIEAIDHPYFVASQFHPEFKSRPNRPHPLFTGFIDASLKKAEH